MLSLVDSFRQAFKAELDHPEPQPRSLEELLEHLSAYGHPRVSRHREGWHASVEMNTPVTGAEFTVRSAFNHESPRAAAQECLSRVLLTISNPR